MTHLNIEEIKQAYIGKAVNEERFSEIFNKSNTFFCGHCDAKLKLKFGITPALYIGWEQRGIDFKIFASVSNGVLTNCSIIKYKSSDSDLCTRASVRALNPTQQELRVFKKVIEYVLI